jgi:N-hydroxyarylamine O-acetyltransferase
MHSSAYFDRIGMVRPAVADADAMRALHRAHRQTFLFENLSIQTGGGVSLAICDLEEKFLARGRGGYCFEHNTLFAAVLRDIAIDATTLLGRVRRGPPHRWCRTHMVLRVPIGDEIWLADVGFGGAGRPGISPAPRA